MVTLSGATADLPTQPRPQGVGNPAEGVAADARMQALYHAHARPLYHFLLRLTFGERLTAEDLLQETLLRAWRNLDGLSAPIDTLRPWLFTVARRVAIDAARARKARPTEVRVVDMATVAMPEDEIERLLRVRAVREALAGLSPEHRSVIVELFYRAHSPVEVAVKLGIPEGTVKSRTFYALRRLRAVLESTGAV